MSSSVRLIRALIIGIVLLPLCCYWSQDQVIDRIFSLMIPPVAMTAVLAFLNLPLRKRMPKIALSSGEIMIIYTVLAVACAMSGEWIDMIGPQIYGFGAFQDNNPRYGIRILPFVSELLFFKDQAPLKDFMYGGKSVAFFFSQSGLWLPKVGMWTLIFTLITTAMLCISSLMREQWVHQERLAFPIVQLPLALAQEDSKSAIWRNPFFWGGFAVVFLIDFVNGLSFLYPSIPRINLRFLADANDAFSSPPLNQTGWTPVGLFPYIAALGFFMPTDLLFSLLFFFVVRKVQQVISYSMGNEQGLFGGGGLVPSAPYFTEQSWGAFIGIFITSLLLAKPHLKKVWEAIETGRDDSGGVPHRWTFLLLIACIVGMGGVGVLVGLPFLFVVLYVSIFLAFSLAITRLRAQLGAPTHEMAFMGPHQLILDFHGSAGLDPALVARTMTTFHMMNRIHRTNPMPTVMEGLYMAERGTDISKRAMFFAIFLAIILGSFVGHYTHIMVAYKWLPTTWVESEVAGVTNSIVTTPKPPNPMAITSIGIGMCVVFLLDFIRFRSPGFWLHPAGYALGMNFGVDYYWFGLLLVLISKVFVQKFYGIKGYDKLRQLAFGLILGEFMAELIWATFSMLNERQTTYSISINGKIGWNQ